MKTDTPETSEAWLAVSRMPDGSFDTNIPSSEFARSMLMQSRNMERQRDEARLEAAQLRLCLQRVKIYAIKIQDVEWGYDGDCGALVLAEYIEEECDKAQSTISKMEIPTQ